MNASDEPARQTADAARSPESGACVSVKIGPITRELRIADIRVVAACQNYTEVILADASRLLVRRPLREWLSFLPSEQFARVHRSLLINLPRLGRIDRGPDHGTRLYFVEAALRPVDVKRRHWPALRARIEVYRSASIHAHPASGDGPSIAVLPFANFSGTANDDIFCDGISEELLNVLAKVSGLRVAARTSSFSFKGKSAPISGIARQLGVQYIVEGSVRRVGRRLRITAQLINGDDGFHIWSDNFERPVTSVLAMQDEIAQMIARQLQLELTARRRAPSVHSEAHRLTLEGRHYWNLRNAAGFTRAQMAFQAAIARDPEYAPAHAGLADLYVIRAMYRLADGALCAADDLDGAEASAERALTVDPTLAEPHATLGCADFLRGRLRAAIRRFPPAFAANPNYATGYHFYAWALAATGRLAAALAVFEKAVLLDPLSFITLDRHAAMLLLANRPADALLENERAAALRPDIFVGNLSQRAPLLWLVGRQTEAIEAARQVRRLTLDQPFRRNSDSDALYVLHQAGLTTEANAYAAEVLARLSIDNPIRGFVLAAVGRYDEALPALVCTPMILQPFLYWSHLWDPVRDRPAFLELIDRLGRTAEYRIARKS